MITKERDKELRAIAEKRNEASRPNPEARALALKIQQGTITKKERKRFDELMEKPGTGGGHYPVFLNSEAESERIRFHQVLIANKSIGEALEKAGGAHERMTEGHLLLTQALAGWVVLQLKPYHVNLTEDEARLFALLITEKRKNRDGETIVMSFRDIGVHLEVSAITVQRRARKLLKDHRSLAKWIADRGIARKPRGTPKKHVTKRKKKT